MKTIKSKYSGKLLSTDEVAEARTAIEQAIKELEGIEYKKGPDYILLKWGTLKGWELTSDAGKQLAQEYYKLGSSASVMLQEDTDKQKELICKMIDECDGVLQNDWSGEYFTKEQAKKYVMEY